MVPFGAPALAGLQHSNWPSLRLCSRRSNQPAKDSEPRRAANPKLARSMHIEGTVRLVVVVAPNGKPTSTKVIGSHPLLAKSSVDAVEKWKWSPAPEESKEVLELRFHPD
jgi:TonB family protein